MILVKLACTGTMLYGPQTDYDGCQDGQDNHQDGHKLHMFVAKIARQSPGWSRPSSGCKDGRVVIIDKPLNQDFLLAT